jgi:hypothetical protein
MRGGCARRSNRLHCSCLATCPGRSRVQRPSMGSPALGGVAWTRRTMLSAALRSRSRWVPSPTAYGRRILRLRLANRSGLGCFSPRTYRPAASKQLHVTWAIVEGWRSIAT